MTQHLHLSTLVAAVLIGTGSVASAVELSNPAWEFRLKFASAPADTNKGPAAAPATPSPAFSFSPASLDFGVVSDGASKDLNIMISNTGGPGTLTLGTVSAPFSVLQSTCPGTLDTNANCTIQVRFSPTAPTLVSATLAVTGETGQSLANIGLSGQGALTNYDLDVKASPYATVFFTIPAGVTSAKLVGGWTGSGSTTKNLTQGNSTYVVGSCFCGGSSGDLVYLDPYLQGTQGNGGRTFRFYLSGVGTFTTVRLQYKY